MLFGAVTRNAMVWSFRNIRPEAGDTRGLTVVISKEPAKPSRWFKDEYDLEVKRKWDEFLKTRDTTEHPEEKGLRSAEPVD